MAYQKQSFIDGVTVLQADHLKHIEDGIVANESAIGKKQDALVSGQNIKTINGQSIIGEGNIEISGGTVSGGGDGSDDSEPEVIPEETVFEQVIGSQQHTPFSCNIEAGERVTVGIKNIHFSEDTVGNIAVYFFNDYTIAFNYQVNLGRIWTYAKNLDVSNQVEGTEFSFIAKQAYTSGQVSISYGDQGADSQKFTCTAYLKTGGSDEQSGGSGGSSGGSSGGQPEEAKEITFGKYIAQDGNGNLQLENSIATIANSVQEQDVRLKQIRVWSLDNGKMRFGIGCLDQRKWALISKTFDRDVTKGANTLDFSNSDIVIPKGEQLFVYNDANEIGKQLIAWLWDNDASEISSEMQYGPVNGAIERLATENGGHISFEYTVETIPTEYVTMSEFESLQETVKNQEAEIADLKREQGCVRGDDGNLYKIKFSGGQLTAEKISYDNVLVVSHSWGWHPANYSLAWNNEHGMAASVEENDFVHLLADGIRAINPQAAVDVVNVADWEHNAGSMNIVDDHISDDNDLVVIRLGENLSTSVGYEENLKAFVNYMKEKAPNADFVLCGTGLGTELAQITKNAATATGSLYAYASFTDADNRQVVGGYVEGWVTNNQGSTYEKEQPKILYQIQNGAVASHPSDYGMLTVANSILTAVNYEEVSAAYNITMDSSVGGTVPKKWVKGGVVTIYAPGASGVSVSSDTSSIEVTDHDNGYYTFYMPSADVTVSIS